MNSDQSNETKVGESLNQNILDALEDAILVVSNEGQVLKINKSLRVYLESQPNLKVQVGVQLNRIIERLDQSEYLKNALASLLGGRISSFNYEMKLPDKKWYNLRATPIQGYQGAVISWQNINTRKEIEMTLEKSLNRYRDMYNKTPVMMHSIDRGFQIISVSDFWLDKMGYQRNEVIGKPLGSFMSEVSRDKLRASEKVLLEKGEIKSVEYQYIKKSGEAMDVLLSAVVEYDESGAFEQSVAGMIDVTDQKVAERELKDSRLKLLESQKISKIGNYEIDLERRRFLASPEATFIMELPSNEGDMEMIEKLIHPNDFTDFWKELSLSMKTGEDFFQIYRILHPHTKNVKWISFRGKVVRNPEGGSPRMTGTIQDISEQRSAEEEIRKLTDRVLLATEIAKLGVWEYDREKDEIFWEDQMYGIFENFEQPATLQEMRDLFLEEDRPILEKNLALIKTGANFIEAEARVLVNGAIKYLRSYTRVLTDNNGRYKGMVGVIYDITVDKKLQKKLESSLDDKNVLLKEVHHRVKNNLQLISSIMALKAYDLEDDKAKVVFEEINNRIKAMAVIYEKLYRFYNVSEIEVSELLMQISQELRVLQAARIQIDVESDRAIVNVDQALLIGLIVSELVSNAVKHGFRYNKEGRIQILFSSTENMNTLCILNNGATIPEDTLSRTTGLGISLIKTFARQLRGELELDKRNGFRICF